MSGMIVTLADLLPETLGFPNVGWIILHLIAIPLVFFIGWKVGRKNPVANP